MKKRQKHYHPLIGIIILLIIAAFIAWYVRRPEPADNSSVGAIVDHNSALQTDSQGNLVPKLKNALNVSDQQADTSIVIDYVSLQGSGYVVIHAANGNNPGPIVAHSNLLKAGAKQDLLVKYTTTPGKHYFAMIHSDDGDGKFDAGKDQPIIGSDGKPIMVTFSIVQ